MFPNRFPTGRSWWRYIPGLSTIITPPDRTSVMDPGIVQSPHLRFAHPCLARCLSRRRGQAPGPAPTGHGVRAAGGHGGRALHRHCPTEPGVTQARKGTSGSRSRSGARSSGARLPLQSRTPLAIVPRFIGLRAALGSKVPSLHRASRAVFLCSSPPASASLGKKSYRPPIFYLQLVHL